MNDALAPHGILVVIAGPSGVGKGTVVRRLKELRPFWESVSLATRLPRPGEIDGKHYHFVERSEFDRRRVAGELLEAFEVYGEWKGTPAAPVIAALTRGDDVLLEIDVQGALSVKDRFPEAVLVFLKPPSTNELERRIVTRGHDSPVAIAERLDAAHTELERADRFDVSVVNDDVDRCAAEIAGILDNYPNRPSATEG
ncbi:MAG: guanylate kinase [Acidimicrobiia bacterium]